MEASRFGLRPPALAAPAPAGPCAASPARPDAAPLVRVESVSKTFGTGPAAVRALEGVSLSIGADEFFTLLGPSGCGKTTLLRLLAGFEHPDRGALILDGRDVAGDPPHRRPVNTVFQSYALFPHLSVADNVGFGLRRLGRRGAAVAERVAAMLHLVRLDGLADRRPDQLSGGQQQRVALARALAPAPRLLLLDEPLSALDLKLRRGMQAELKRIQRESGIAFVLVTHDQEEAMSMSDRLAVMEGGRVLQVGRPADVYARPNCRFVAEFLGEANVLPGPLLGLASRYAAIRPERVELRTGPGPGFPGRVTEVAFLGPVTAAAVALDAGPAVRVARGELPPGLAAGLAVRCLFPAEAVLALER